jgi:hypothetical protein
MEMTSSAQAHEGVVEEAKRLILQGGEAVREAPGLLAAATRAGSPEAPCIMAILSGAGLGRAPNWDEAIDLLALSADRGWASARAQIALMTGMQPGAGSWRMLAQRIRIPEWIAEPVSKRSLCETPKLRVIEDFAPATMCDWIMGRASGQTRRARVYDQTTGVARLHTEKNHTELQVALLDCDLPLLALRARIAAATGVPLEGLEPTKVLHYAAGEQYARHVDYLEPSSLQASEREGQRIVSFFVYLNDEYEGGETDFPDIGIRHRGRKGEALYFSNIAESGAPDPRTAHAGLRVTIGDKWVLTQWIRNKPQLS